MFIKMPYKLLYTAIFLLLLTGCTISPGGLQLPGVQVHSPFAEEGATPQQLQALQMTINEVGALKERVAKLETENAPEAK